MIPTCISVYKCKQIRSRYLTQFYEIYLVAMVATSKVQLLNTVLVDIDPCLLEQQFCTCALSSYMVGVVHELSIHTDVHIYWSMQYCIRETAQLHMHVIICMHTPHIKCAA